MTGWRGRSLFAALLLVWVAAAQAGATDLATPGAPRGPHVGGTLRLTAYGAAGSIDPAINYEVKYAELYNFTQDGLVTFRKVEGPRGTDVVADLAESVPVPADGGLTYVFKLRHGIRFSTGQELTVRDVVASLQRMFKVMGPNVGTWYNVIIGGDACVKTPATCTLAGGVEADEAAGTVTLHLTHPSQEFLQQLAMPFASILPADTPPHDLGTTPPAATGPYMISSYNPIHGIHLVRNPYFREWSHDAQPFGYVDAMEYRFGLQDESEVTAIENGQQDWMFEEKPNDRLAEIGGKYASLAHIHPMLAYYYVEMNVRLAPFNNVKARQAVAYALNRRALVNLFGGPGMGSPTCQLLPPGMPGYVPYCPYTKNPGERWTAPDLDRARALVRESGTAGQKVTLITADKQVERTMGIYLQSVLSDIGYDASVRAISTEIQFNYLQNSNNKVQIGLTDWYQDYPAPSDFLAVMFSCKSIHDGSDASINMSGFCDPAIEAEMDRALAMTDPAQSLPIWTRMDRKITDLAPSASLFQINDLVIVSKRVGNFVFHPLFHMLFSQAWVQ